VNLKDEKKRAIDPDAGDRRKTKCRKQVRNLSKLKARDMTRIPCIEKKESRGERNV